MTHTPAIFQLPLAVPFWVTFFFAFIREAKVVRPAFAEKATLQDAGTFRALIVGSPLSLFVAGAAAYLPWFIIPNSTVAVAVGIALIVAGAILRRACLYALSASFTGVVIVKEGQEIIQTGPYRFIRHPSYTAAFLMFSGVGIALESWLSVAILLLAHFYLYGRRVVVEERALVQTLGSAYSDYMRRTKRFIPFVI